MRALRACGRVDIAIDDVERDAARDEEVEIALANDDIERPIRRRSFGPDIDGHIERELECGLGHEWCTDMDGHPAVG